MICVDASVVVKWLLDEEHSTEARNLRRFAIAEEEPIIAPPLLLSEVANVIRQRHRGGVINADEARALLARLLALPITLQSPGDLLIRALEVAIAYNLPVIYDAQYVALAEMTGADFWTADRRLVRSLGGLPFVHDIADWRPPAEPA